MKERYQPIIETEKVKIYQKSDKALIVSDRGFTFQNKDKILKRPRKMKEQGHYGHYQFSKDVYSETDKDLTKRHYSEKGGHKARHDFKENPILHEITLGVMSKKELDKKLKEDPIITEFEVFPNNEQPLESQLPKNSVYEAQKWLYENKKRERSKFSAKVIL